MSDHKKDKLRVVIIEDNPDDCELIAIRLRQEFELTYLRVDSPELLRSSLKDNIIDLVICDYRMPEFSIRDAFDILSNHDVDIPIIVVTGSITQPEAVILMEEGARDYLLKDDLHRLIPAIKRELRDARIRRELVENEHALAAAEIATKEAEERAALADQLTIINAELKETQLQLVQAAKMVSLGELVAGIAHEVNNPLAYAMSHISTIRKNLKDIEESVSFVGDSSKRDKVKKCSARLNGIEEGLQRVRELVKTLRVFARRDEAEFKQGDLRDGIESTLTLLSHRIGNGVVVERQYADNNTIFCAPGSINQVVMNLISNALDAIDGQGVIRITTDVVDKYFTIRISDSGKGVLPEARERLFEPFFTTKAVGQGMGMGLAISYRIVERHNGKIEVTTADLGGQNLW